MLADARADFEGLLAFYNAFPNEHGLMCWNIARLGRDMEVHLDPAKGARGSATDGDLDAAYALLLAGATSSKGVRKQDVNNAFCL